DYIEIACTFKYRVRLVLKSGAVIEGRALDTRRNGEREECILMENAGIEQCVVQQEIARMVALTENPHFHAVSFS
ncbi:MAG: Rho-binding antiterminator, partial [Marinobacterium sp.]